MKFRTELSNYELPFEINYRSKLFFMGSCFAENIGDRFEGFKFNGVINPMGVLFNPISIFEGLSSFIHEAVPSESDFVTRDGTTFSWNHHSIVSNDSQEGLIKEIHRLNRSSHKHLEDTDILFITVGSAWVYRNLETKKIVANCHKIPSQEFRREFLDTDDIIDSFRSLYSDLKHLNPDIKIVFTVSPVRHIRDGLIENNISKSELIRSVHKITKQFSNCYYLPAFEWVIDDLRDYRFFQEDLVHPNKMAIDYVWDRVSDLFFSEQTKKDIKLMNKFVSGCEHKAFQPLSKSHQHFLGKLINQGEELQDRLGINLRYEIHSLEDQIIKL
ncbi:MAG: GSCFA domain-containing protein [Salibacteraceae bacterium]